MEPIKRIENSDEFIYAVGSVIFFCQCIEHDVKSIYYGMREDMGGDEYEKSQKWTLGMTVERLERLDNSDGRPYFAKEDFDLLRKLTDIRNFYAHKCYVEWVYESDDKTFRKVANRLVNDHNRLLKLHQIIEQARIRFHSGE